MKGAITVLLLVFVAAAVFVFLIAVDSRYSLPGIGQSQPQGFQQVQPNDIQSLLAQLRQIDGEINSLKEQQRMFDDNLNSLASQRQGIVDEINDWMKRDQVNEPRAGEEIEAKVLHPRNVLVPQQ
tara:strand:+ start:3379 stop:3753 length:375 start_codon:yes stop_codon:yes gene_type:complete